MPPKSKKQQQDEAKRLQQEQKKKEEEQARLLIEQQKYSSQTISTGLMLPASNQLIVDFSSNPLAFTHQKLTSSITSQHEGLDSHDKLFKLVLKELSYCIKDSLNLFGLRNVKEVEGNQQCLLKARVYVGVCLKLLLNGKSQIGENDKSKSNDQQLLKTLLAAHVQSGEGKLKVFNGKDIQNILKSIKKSYFNHYLVLWNHNKFQKRVDTLTSHIYASSPAVNYNDKDTHFIDLTVKEEKEIIHQEEEPEEKLEE